MRTGRSTTAARSRRLRYRSAMTELIWVAAITTLGTLLGAAVGSLSSVFGPAWQQRKAQAEADARARDDVRFERAQVMLDAMGTQLVSDYASDVAQAEAHRVAFVATLRPGEGAADTFTRDLSSAIRKAGRRRALAISAAGASVVFAWLRGDAPITSLTLDGAGISPPTD